MKINFILPQPDLSGGWRVLANYAQLLSERGHEVTCIWATRPRKSLREKLRSVRHGKGWPREVREPSHFDELDLPFVEINPHRPITDNDVPDGDVVIATWWETAEWVSKLSPSKGAKVYFIQHRESQFDGVPTDRAEATWRLPMPKITISRWLVDLARDEFGDEDVTLVPNSVDMSQFFAPPRSRQPVPTVGLLYSTTRFKGCDVSFEALRKVAEQFPNLKVIAFGAELESPQLPLPPNSEFHFRPAQDAIRELYARCDVWLCGSHSEGFHLPPLEAMACRCPVVSTAVGGSIDVIENGVNGYVVNVGDAAALADRLVRVLSLAPEPWRVMSDAALATAQRYTWDDAAALFEQALFKAVQSTAVESAVESAAVV
ncbi:MAG: glycosyltransferase family 4 protein [Phycisphaerae bacterium]|nr:glycosyltransferase family 4 protein [Phycisphaerae bacterium]